MQPLGNLNINDQKGKGLYPVPKASAEMEFAREREKLTSRGKTLVAGFANPVQNVQHFNLEPGMQVADLGSGSGHYVMAMANVLGSSGRVYAVDVQKELLSNIKNESTKRGYDNIEVIWGDIEKPGGAKIADGLLDVVLVSNTLFQVEDKPALLREAHRLLKPSGMLIIIDWSESFASMGPIVSEVVSKDQALDVTLSVGFSFKEEFAAGAHHYGLKFSKI